MTVPGPSERDAHVVPKRQVLQSVFGVVGVAWVIFISVLCGGLIAEKLFNMSCFQGSLVLLGVLFLLASIWAVRSLAEVGVGLGHEVKSALDTMEAMWADSEVEPPEDWQGWSGGARPYLSRDRVGEPLCPCGSGKPYSMCCGRKN